MVHIGNSEQFTRNLFTETENSTLTLLLNSSKTGDFLHVTHLHKLKTFQKSPCRRLLSEEVEEGITGTTLLPGLTTPCQQDPSEI